MRLHEIRSVEDEPTIGNLRSSSNDLMSTRARVPSSNERTLGALAVGASAMGALAIGAFAIGALAIGRLAIGCARIRRLEIDELVVARLLVTDSVETPGHTTD